MKKYLGFSFMALFAMFALTVVSCSKDDDAVDGGKYNNGILTVNGQKWSSGFTIPAYYDDQFIFYSENGHVLSFSESLDDVEKGEDVSPDYVLLPSDNAEYKYVDGEIVVVKTDYPKSVTVKFDNYTVKYMGEYISGGGDNRKPDIKDADELVMNGTITFWSEDYLTD